jgi:WD40 repeat protein
MQGEPRNVCGCLRGGLRAASLLVAALGCGGSGPNAGVDAAVDQVTGDTAADHPAADAIGDISVEQASGDGSADGPTIPTSWDKLEMCGFYGWDTPDGLAIARNGTVALGGPVVKVFGATTAPNGNFLGVGGRVKNVAFSPDSTLLAASAVDIPPALPNGVVVFRVTDGSIVWSAPTGREVSQMAFSPDGTLLGLARTDGVEMLDATTGTSIATFTGHGGGVQSLAFSLDGTMIASSSSSMSAAADKVLLWKVVDRTVVRSFSAGAGFVRLAFSPDQSELLGVGSPSGIINRWRVSDASPITPVGQIHSFGGAAWAPDGKTFFASGQLFRASDGMRLRYMNVGSAEVAYLPDSSGVLVLPARAGFEVVDPIVWNVLDGSTGARYGGETVPATGHLQNEFGVSPDGAQLRLGNAAFRLDDGQGSSGAPAAGGPGPYGTANFSPDGQSMANGGMDIISISVLPGGTGSARNWSAHNGQVNAVAFSPDGSQLASGGADHLAKIWNVSDGSLVRVLGGIDGHTDAVMALAWSPDGQRLVSGAQEAYVWRVSDGAILATLRPGIRVREIAFSPDGNTVVINDSGKSVVWDIVTGQQVATSPPYPPLAAGPTATQGLDFSPTGDLVVSTSISKSALWSPSGGHLVTTIPLPLNGLKAAFTKLGVVVMTETALPSGPTTALAYHWCRR